MSIQFDDQVSNGMFVATSDRPTLGDEPILSRDLVQTIFAVNLKFARMAEWPRLWFYVFITFRVISAVQKTLVIEATAHGM